MTEQSYSEKLKNPIWQKKRLQILERDEFCCQKCFDSESTLHVHHCYYTKGNDPWDYPDMSLITLCEKCHKKEHDNITDAKEELCITLLEKHVFYEGFKELSEGIKLSDWFFSDPYCISALSWAISNEEIRKLILKKFDEYVRDRIRSYDNGCK